MKKDQSRRTVTLLETRSGELVLPIPADIQESKGWEIGQRLRFRHIEGAGIHLDAVSEDYVLADGEEEGRVEPMPDDLSQGDHED